MNDLYLTHFIWQFIQWKTSRFMELIHLRILTKLKRNPNQNFSTSSKKTHSEFVLVCNRRMDVLHWKKRSRSRNIDFSVKPNIMYFLLRRMNFNYFFRCIYNLHHTYSENLKNYIFHFLQMKLYFWTVEDCMHRTLRRHCFYSEDDCICTFVSLSKLENAQRNVVMEDTDLQ